MDPRMMGGGVPMRQKVVDFKILKSINSDVIGQEILEHLKKGWSLHGELKEFSGCLIQAVVKVELERMDTAGSDILIPRPILG